MEIQMKKMLSAACSLLFLLITTTTLWAQIAGALPPFDGSKKLSCVGPAIGGRRIHADLPL